MLQLGKKNHMNHSLMPHWIVANMPSILMMTVRPGTVVRLMIAENQLLYVAEPKVDGANAIIHVFRINSSSEDEKVLSSITISGVTQLDEGDSATFSCTANYSDGSSSAITPTWNDDSDYASIDSSGVLTAASVDADQTVTITASYNGETATYSVTINDVPGSVIELSSISISGATQLDEGNSATFSCTAIYSDGSSTSITPTWGDDSDYASIDSSGVLTAASVDADETVTITASYNGETATYSVTINDLTRVIVWK